jgi:hypothetical protein
MKFAYLFSLCLFVFEMTDAQNTYLGTGNVGVGVNPGLTTLDVYGTFHVGSNSQVVAPSISSGGIYIAANRSSGQGEVNIYNVYNGASTSFIFSQKTGTSTYTDIMSFFANGNVGIGTSNAGTARLAVEGTIETRKVVVTQTNPFPDYVFHPSYQLPRLDSVAGFIAANHHLPGMPSADSVARVGLDLGNNQVILVRKVEELTLYIIEQDKQLKQKDHQLEALDQRLKQLEDRLALLGKGKG